MKLLLNPSFCCYCRVNCRSTGNSVCTEIDDTLNMCPIDLEKKINKNTRAVIVVHMLGVPAKMSEIKDLQKK